MEQFNFDDYLTNTLGEFGLYQIFIVSILCIPACFLSSWHSLHLVFLFYTPPHQCNSQKISTGYYSNVNDSLQYSQCSLNVNWLNDSTNFSTSVVECDSWTFDTTYFDETVVTTWNLVCKNSVLSRTFVAIMDMATCIAVFYSFLMDHWGRKKTFLLSLTALLIGNGCSLLAPNLASFVVLKFIGHITSMWQIVFCWAIEFVGPSRRTWVTTIITVLFSVATVFLGLLAYFSRTWVQIGFLTSVPFVSLYLICFIVPESPRWLLSQNKVEDAVKVIEKMAYWNKVKIDPYALEEKIKKAISTLNKTNEENVCSQIRRFLCSSNLRSKVLIMAFLGITTDQLLNVVPYSLEKLQANFILAFILQALVETPATLVNLLLLNKFGRILPLSCSLVLASVFCVLTWPMSHTGVWGPVLVAIAAKFFIIQAAAIINQIEAEMYPTTARGLGSGLRYFITSLTVVTTQYIIHSNILWNILPLIIMGLLNTAAGFLCLFLPDTTGSSLPDTLDDAEKLGKVGWKSFAQHFKFRKYVAPISDL